jgi:hypothetical protein
MAPNHFTELYSSYSTEKLVAVVTAPLNYQPEAVEAAQNELAKRNVSDDEIERLREEILNTPPTVTKAEKLTGEAVNYTSKKLTDFVSAPGKPRVESLLNRFLIVLVILTLLKFYNGWWMIHFMFSYPEEAGFDFSILVFFIDYLIVPVSTYFIWKRKPLGWYLLCIFSVANIIISCDSFYYALTWKPSNFALINALSPKVDITVVVFVIFFWAATLMFLARKALREIFKIKTRAMLYSIIIPAIIVAYSIWF